MTWPAKHLTADDLDAFHSGSVGHDAQLHLETCDECRRLVVLDRELLAHLGRLPTYGPSDLFASRVMARVEIGSPAPVPVLSYPKLTRARIAAITSLAAGVVVSVAWSATNRQVLDAWLDGTGAALWQWGQTALENGLSLVTAQPWFESVRSLAGTPARLGLVAAASIVLYGTGLLALRRLVSPPVSNAEA